MKTQIEIIAIVSFILLLSSCEKGVNEQDDFPYLSIDSLKIIQSNLPGGLYTDLTFINKTTGYAISNFGTIIKTSDCGHTWEQLSSPVDFFLNRIQFTDFQTGYIIGGDITGGYLLKTADAGESWQLINLNTPDKVTPTGIFFISNTKGFISGKKLFIKTTDGGLTWLEVMGAITENINDINFKNSNDGYATSDNGKYFKTVDGGKTWQQMQSDTDEHLKRIYFAGSKSLAKCRTNVFMDLETGNTAFTVPSIALNFLFLTENRCIGIGQHYETGFLPYGDVFLTNDAWKSFKQKIYNPQSEAMNVTAIAEAEDGKVIIIGSGTVNISIIQFVY